MTKDAVVASLYAIRAQVDALILHLDGAMSVGQIAGCPHPEDKQVDSTTAGGGHRRVFCLACNTERDA